MNNQNNYLPIDIGLTKTLTTNFFLSVFVIVVLLLIVYYISQLYNKCESVEHLSAFGVNVPGTGGGGTGGGGGGGAVPPVPLYYNSSKNFIDTKNEMRTVINNIYISKKNIDNAVNVYPNRITDGDNLFRNAKIDVMTDRSKMKDNERDRTKNIIKKNSNDAIKIYDEVITLITTIITEFNNIKNNITLLNLLNTNLNTYKTELTNLLNLANQDMLTIRNDLNEQIILPIPTIISNVNIINTDTSPLMNNAKNIMNAKINNDVSISGVISKRDKAKEYINSVTK